MNTALLVSHIFMWALVLLVGGLLLATIRQVGLIHRRIEPYGARTVALGPQIGDTAPQFEVKDVRGKTSFLGSRDGKRTLLIFMSPHCSTCEDIAPALRSVEKSERHTTDTMIVCHGDRDGCGRFASRLKIAHIPIIAVDDLQQIYGVSATPFAIIVDAAGIVRAKGIVNHFEHIESLLRAAELEVDSLETFVEAEKELSNQPSREMTTETTS